MNQPLKTVPQLFRDCLRLVNHVAGKDSAKSINIRKIVGGEFRKNKDEKNADVIDGLRGNAVRALSNYLMLSSLSKDKSFKAGASAFNDRQLKSAKEEMLQEAEFEEMPPMEEGSVQDKVKAMQDMMQKSREGR
jgi:hypothetical protein